MKSAGEKYDIPAYRAQTLRMSYANACSAIYRVLMKNAVPYSHKKSVADLSYAIVAELGFKDLQK